MSKINNDWKEILEEEFQKDYFVELKIFLKRSTKITLFIHQKKDILNAFFLTPYSEVKSCTFRTRSLSSERSGTWFFSFI